MSCPASICLTPTDEAVYAALPNPVYDTSGEHGCALSAGHDSDHGSEIQSATFSDRSYWAIWSDDKPDDYRIMRLTNCTTTRRRPDHTTALCLLYDGHGGEHDWIDEQD